MPDKIGDFSRLWLALTFCLSSTALTPFGFAQDARAFQACRPTQIDTAVLGAVKRQGLNPWCYAHAASDLVSMAVGASISADSIVADEYAVKYSAMLDADARFLFGGSGGSPADAINDLFGKGYCLESKFSSDNDGTSASALNALKFKQNSSEVLFSGLILRTQDFQSLSTDGAFKKLHSLITSYDLLEMSKKFVRACSFGMQHCDEPTRQWAALQDQDKNWYFIGLDDLNAKTPSAIHELNESRWAEQRSAEDFRLHRSFPNKVEILSPSWQRISTVMNQVENHCESRIKPSQYFKAHSFSSWVRPDMVTKLDQILDSGQIAAISIGGSSTMPHAVTVIGRNPTPSGECEYTIRDSGFAPYVYKKSRSQISEAIGEVYFIQNDH